MCTYCRLQNRLNMSNILCWQKRMELCSSKMFSLLPKYFAILPRSAKFRKNVVIFMSRTFTATKVTLRWGYHIWRSKIPDTLNGYFQRQQALYGIFQYVLTTIPIHRKSWSSHLHSTCTLFQVKRNLLTVKIPDIGAFKKINSGRKFYHGNSGHVWGPRTYGNPTLRMHRVSVVSTRIFRLKSVKATVLHFLGLTDTSPSWTATNL